MRYVIGGEKREQKYQTCFCRFSERYSKVGTIK
jgi:hypothetical protein